MKFLISIPVFLFLSSNVLFAQYTDGKQDENTKEYLEENRKQVEQLRKEKNGNADIDINSKESVKKTVDDSVKPPEEKADNFFFLGGSIGSPASINFNTGFIYRRLVARASGNYFDSRWNGYQGDLGFIFHKTSTVIQSFSLVGGEFNVDPVNPQAGRGGQKQYNLHNDIPGYGHNPPTVPDLVIRDYILNTDPVVSAYLEYQYAHGKKTPLHQSYVGLTYDIRLGGFFFQLGLGSGRGDYKNPQLLFQFGYMFDFGRNK
ncbi:MAG: hypothetical protein K8R21_15320 [Leptospira sp.]|nr:hypothetical protein [Leptospira sp.]